MTIEQVPDIPMFRQNTAAFVHDLDADSLANVDGDSNYVRVQVLTNAGALDRDKQLAVVRRLTDIIAAAADDPTLADRTWVLLTEAPEGGMGPARACEQQRGTRQRRTRPDRGAEQELAAHIAVVLPPSPACRRRRPAGLAPGCRLCRRPRVAQAFAAA